MVSEKRHKIILNLLNKKGIISLSDIVEATDTSESTIRRDLTTLENKGALIRFHGGAKLITSSSQELSYSEKSCKNLESKKAIALLASKEIEYGNCIYLDAGTTTIEMIPFLKDKNILVVTNGLKHIDELVENNIQCYIIGGKVKSSTKAIVGSDALKSIMKFRFDKCFLGTNAVHPTMGLTTPDTDEAIIKETALSLSKETYILCDESKFGEVSFAKFADISDVTIISDIKSEDIDLYENLTEIKVVEKL
ncbi:DeoR/GlpR family DNA-binding transcription regulator [Clostridium sp.]|uniref:DeoR/GlpR family DNA-binding transcription regulator n=1 Tax=Clostridium sp. TaxID=1506 RepID=UPI003F2F2626